MAGPQLNRGMITVSIMLATVMQSLDTTIANVALPHIQGSLSASQEQATWILTSYIVAAAIMTAPTGFLASRLGRKVLFLVNIAGFTITSALCGAAVGLTQIVIYRLLQGVFGAGLVPLSQAVLLDINPKERHGQAMAMWGVGVMLGPILGPTLGGFLTEYYSWRWVFYINMPIGIAAFLGVMIFMPDTGREPGRKFDWFGFILLSLFIGTLQLALDRGVNQDWFSSREIIAEAVVSGLSLYLFLVHILSGRRPFLDPKMFTDRNFSVCVFFISIIGIVLLASMALLPPFFQDLMGFPVLLTGLVLAPRGIGTMGAMMLVGRLINRVDARILIGIGLLLTAYSLYQMSLFNLDVSTSTIVLTGIIQGFGMGFVFVPLSTMAYATLAPHFRNDAVAVYSLGRNIGSSVGISVVVAMLARNTQISHADLAAGMASFGSAGGKAGLFTAAAERIGLTGDAALALLDSEVNRQASTIAYLNDFRLMTYIVLLSIPLLLLMRDRRRRESAAEVTDDAITSIE